jgi:tetratricopeptide (TPR) repeat protein
MPVVYFRSIYFPKDVKADYAEDCNKLDAIYAQVGKTVEAIALFERALQIQPDFAAAHYNLGCLYTWLKKFKKAKNLIEQVIRLQPQNAEARLFFKITLPARK